VKVAFAAWKNRISPVFDAAPMLYIVDIENGRVVEDRHEILSAELPYTRAARLSDLGIRVLVCGAISMEFSGLIEMYGIQVIPFVTGDVPQVLDAYLKGSLFMPSLRMPGFQGGRRNRHQGGRGRGRGHRGR